VSEQGIGRDKLAMNEWMYMFWPDLATRGDFATMNFFISFGFRFVAVSRVRRRPSARKIGYGWTFWPSFGQIWPRGINRSEFSRLNLNDRANFFLLLDSV
jgi:hypothetical protein